MHSYRELCGGRNGIDRDEVVIRAHSRWGTAITFCAYVFLVPFFGIRNPVFLLFIIGFGLLVNLWYCRRVVVRVDKKAKRLLVRNDFMGFDKYPFSRVGEIVQRPTPDGQVYFAVKLSDGMENAHSVPLTPPFDAGTAAPPEIAEIAAAVKKALS